MDETKEQQFEEACRRFEGKYARAAELMERRKAAYEEYIQQSASKYDF